MTGWTRATIATGIFAVTALAVAVPSLTAQSVTTNPFRPVYGWGELPEGREWGSTSAVEIALDGNIWVAERCGANTCVGSDVDPILLFDKEGNLLRSFGGGMIAWPHGIDVDHEGNVWIADARGNQAGNKGHQVTKFSPDGDVLLRIGTAGVAGRTRTTLDEPNDVLVAPNGNIFVGDGHPADGNSRIVKYSPDGTYLMEWGETGSESGQFRTPHSLAMDSEGLLYVGDRSNRRVQVFDQDGNFIRDILHVGRASGLTIDSFDRLYVADSESNYSRNPGFERGIRVIDISDFRVIAFIPDPEPDPDNAGTSAAEGVAVDNDGNVYGAEVGPRAFVRYITN